MGEGRMQSRGFSLLELMLTLFIVALAIAMGCSVAGGTRGHMSVQQVAQELLADLRWARQQAMTRGVPAGILLPGAMAAGQAYDVVEADVDAPGAIRVMRTEDWSSDGHYALLAVGTWGGLPFQQTDATFPGRQDASTRSLLTQVSGSWPGRYVMFDPNGSTVTSGVPSARGEHYLVVTAGLRESGGNLDAVWRPATTVRLAADGYASLVEGVPSHPSMQDGPPEIPALGSLPPNLPVGPLQYPKPYALPTIVKLDVLPTANVDALPPGAVAGSTYSVVENGRLCLTVTAQDANGDRLYCNWYSSAVPSVPNAAPSPPPNSAYDAPAASSGNYSVSGIQPMAPASTAGQWTDTVEWSPPPTAKPGDWFELGVVIDDLRGGKDARWIVVGVIDDAKIAFESDRAGTYQVYIMNSDGTNPLRLTSGSWQHVDPCAAPDGTKVVFASNETGVYQLWAMNLDGSGLRRVASSARSDAQARFSPDGTCLAFASTASDASGNDVYRINLDGQGRTQLTSAGGPDWDPCWGENHLIAFSSKRSGSNGQIFVMDEDGHEKPPLTDKTSDASKPIWIEDGARLAFGTDRAGGWEIYAMSADGSSPKQVTNGASVALDSWMSWDASGHAVLFCSTRDGNNEVYSLSLTSGVLVNLTRDAASDQTPSWAK